MMWIVLAEIERCKGSDGSFLRFHSSYRPCPRPTAAGACPGGAYQEVAAYQEAPAAPDPIRHTFDSTKIPT